MMTINIRSLQRKIYLASLCFHFLKRKVLFLVLIIILINMKSIFSYIKNLFLPILNQIDTLISNHETIYYAVILTINAIVIIHAFTRGRR